MSKKITTLQDAFAAFKADFSGEALTVDKSRWNPKTNKGLKLTSIKAQYIVERLNEVLYDSGAGGWYFTGTHKETENGVLFFGQLTITVGDQSVIREAVGFKQFTSWSKNDGDLYKSAQTDSLSKCASHLGIGNEVYKGNVAPDDIPEITITNNDSDKDDDDYSVSDEIEASDRGAPMSPEQDDSIENVTKLKTKKKFKSRGTTNNSGSRFHR